MSRYYWDNQDDRYDDYDAYSDYGNYYGRGNRGVQKNRGGQDYRSGSGYRRETGQGTRTQNRSARNYRRESGYNANRKYPNDFSERQARYEGFDEEKEEVSSGLIYVLMTAFFGILIITVLMGRMSVDHSSIPDTQSESLYASSSESPVSSEPETVDPVAQKIESELNSMTNEQKVGQLFMVRKSGNGTLFDTVSQIGAGGAILFADDFKGKSSDEVRDMISEIQSCSDGRMIIAVDEEGGDVVRISSNSKLRSSRFLSPQRLFKKGGFDLIVSDTQEKCDLLHSLGLNMNMAPVADVCTSSSGFMYRRSFGKGAEETAEYVTKVISVMNETPVASCVKHFPGYGNSKSDTHKGLDVNTKTLTELKESDLVPFEAAIREGVDSIMLTHTVIDSVDPDHPASLSVDVVDIIREDMGFDGVLITDGLEMGAINEYSGGDSGKVCVMAVLAGIDILCAPKNPVDDYNAVLEAVNYGEISQERLDESVRRILKLKIRLGMYADQLPE
ncbi:MAG: beta-hexosaminidase [Clostridia bacterium]|nr:beta-hexosaminidase [Clostridia bacterium]